MSLSTLDGLVGSLGNIALFVLDTFFPGFCLAISPSNYINKAATKTRGVQTQQQHSHIAEGTIQVFVNVSVQMYNSSAA